MRRLPILIVSGALAGTGAFAADPAPNDFAPYAEPGFPWFASVVDATESDVVNRGKNLTVRGILLRPGGGHYACFDTDLLRLAAVWKAQPDGAFLEMNGIATLSYDVDFRKAPGGQEALPRLLGGFVMGNAPEPGWVVRESGQPLDFSDPRAPAPAPDEPGRGPLPRERGHFDRVRMIEAGPGCQLEYTVAGTGIRERLAVDARGILRHLEVEPHTKVLVLVLSNTPGMHFQTWDGREVAEIDGRRVVSFSPSAEVERGWILMTSAESSESSESKAGSPLAEPASFDSAPARHWQGTVTTRGVLSADQSSPYVVDDLSLPMPNPWKRKVRLTGIDFFPDGRAALVTLDGDVWILGNIDAGLERLRWQRVASGLHEPQSIRVRDGELFVFDKNGLQRLVDCNGDGEVDCYENFCSDFGQTAETREYPNDFVVKPDGGFFLAKGGQVLTRLGKHNGAVIEVTADGARSEVYARGLRQPFLGMHPETGLLTASDQQGHFIPSSPVHWIRRGGYYGFDQSVAHPELAPPITPPLTWIPHEVCQSGAGHVWMDSARFGALSGALVHLAFHHPGAHRVYLDFDGTAEDILASPPQAAVVPLQWDLAIPVLKGAVNPADGQLYVCGSAVWGSSSSRVSGLQRVRYNPAARCLQPSEIRVTSEGVLLRFPFALQPAADPLEFLVRRWNYLRSSGYGSGHYRLDGSPGEEIMPVSGIHYSNDRRAVLLRLPDMRAVMQLAVSYSLRTSDGSRFGDAAYMTPQRVHPFSAAAAGFAPLPPVTAELAAQTAGMTSHADRAEPTADYGQSLATQFGCLGCHSTDGTMAGQKGPTWKGLAGSQRTLISGATVTADRAYLMESILDPTAKVATGFETIETGMPPYKGILSELQLDSLLLYLKKLAP